MVFLLTAAEVDLKKKNKAHQRPIDLVDPRNKALRLHLLTEEFRKAEGAGVVNNQLDEDEEEKERYDRDHDSLLSQEFDDGYDREPLSDSE